MFEIIAKIKASKGRKIIDNEILHLNWLKIFLKSNINELKRELDIIRSICLENPRLTKKIKNRCFYGYLRRLCNALESYYILKQHMEEVIEKYQSKKKFNKECAEKRKFYKLKCEESVFVLRFRAYIIHHNLPNVNMNLLYEKETGLQIGVYLSKNSLLEWSDWNTKSEEILPFINKFNENIDFNKIFFDAANNLICFIDWLVEKIIELNKYDIKEYDELIDEWNKIGQ